MTDVTLTVRRLGALDGRSPERVRPTTANCNAHIRHRGHLSSARRMTCSSTPRNSLSTASTRARRMIASSASGVTLALVKQDWAAASVRSHGDKSADVRFTPESGQGLGWKLL
jgi:hypothetical protein